MRFRELLTSKERNNNNEDESKGEHVPPNILNPALVPQDIANDASKVHATTRACIARDEDIPPIPPDLAAKHPVPKPTFHDPFHVDADFPRILDELLTTIDDPLVKPAFNFSVSKEAATENWNLLEDNDYDLHGLLNGGERSATTYGSEFKSTKELERLMGRHPRWQYVREILTNGVNFPVAEVSERLRRLDIEAAVKRGNHKSAIQKNDVLEKSLEKEIAKGWIVTLPVEAVRKLPDVVINPMGVATHLGVSEDGTFVPKDRITHDLSFPGKFSMESVNSRVNESELEPCMFGHTLLRMIHYIVNLRRRHKKRRIFVRKEDFKSAFRRLHLNAVTALRSATIVPFAGTPYLLLSLRMPFGGSPCPSAFSTLSDVITDTINDLLSNKKWNHKNIYADKCNNIPPNENYDDKEPFAQAKDMSVELPDEDEGKADCFIDDICSIVVDIGENVERLRKAPITVMEAVSLNSDNSGYLVRDNLVAEDKMIAEGAPAEKKICLGWELDTRKLLVCLPDHKYIAWRSQIDESLKRTTVSNDTLMSILGRLENIAQLQSMMGHFLNNIRHLQITAERKEHNVRWNKRSKDDLDLVKLFLEKANKGISMNTIVFRKPDIVYICDASEHGLGGYASHGRAWRLMIPEEVLGRAHINILEYLAQLVCIWIDVLEHKVKEQNCLLAMGDNKCALGWMRRSNFRQTEDDDVS